MKRYIIITAFLFSGLFMLNSCSKSFLNERVYNSYAPSTLADSLGLEASVVGLHNQFSQFLTKSDRQGWLGVWQDGTDITWATQPEGIERPYFNYENLTSTDAAAQFTWQWAYKLINNANIIIDNIESGNVKGMATKNMDVIDADARFYRAYGYNVLATCFGAVPLVTKPLSGAKTDFVRTALDSVNAQIVADLQYGAKNLPLIDNVQKDANGKPLYARSNKAMAQQLLGEVYLRMGEPANAEEQLKAIINSGEFKLVRDRYGIKKDQPGDPYSDMFIYGNERRSQGNTEAIWVMESENPRNVPGGMTNYPQQRRMWGGAYHNVTGMIPADSLGGRGLARLRINNWVAYQLYEKDDMRNSKYNIRRHFWYNDPSKPDLYGKEVPQTDADTLYYLCPYITKWGQFDPLDVFGFGMWKDFIMMRYSETYLLLAEAQFKQNHLADAAASLNVVRERSNASPITAGDVTMDFILDERARELIGEENRRMTLMRTGTLLERVQRLNMDPAFTENPITGLTQKNLLLPIPQSEIDLNKDGNLEQNPGY